LSGSKSQTSQWVSRPPRRSWELTQDANGTLFIGQQDETRVSSRDTVGEEKFQFAVCAKNRGGQVHTDAPDDATAALSRAIAHQTCGDACPIAWTCIVRRGIDTTRKNGFVDQHEHVRADREIYKTPMQTGGKQSHH
jgi:hypothetical protein